MARKFWLHVNFKAFLDSFIEKKIQELRGKNCLHHCDRNLNKFDVYCWHGMIEICVRIKWWLNLGVYKFEGSYFPPLFFQNVAWNK